MSRAGIRRLDACYQNNEGPGAWLSTQYDTRLGPATFVTGFGFAVPSNATITGVEAKWRGAMWQDDSGGTILFAQLTSGHQTTSLIGTRKGTGGSVVYEAAPVVSFSYNRPVNNNNAYQYDWTDVAGASNDLWGAALTPTVVNDADFGIAFAVFSQADEDMQPYDDLSVDGVVLRVHYTVGGTAYHTGWQSAAGGGISVPDDQLWIDENYPKRNFYRWLSRAWVQDDAGMELFYAAGDSLVCTNAFFTTGFTTAAQVPANATITGIEIGFRVKRGEGPSHTYGGIGNVQLCLGDRGASDLIGTMKTNAVELMYASLYSYDWYTCGGSSDTWGVSNLTRAMMVNPNFGFAWQAKITGLNPEGGYGRFLIDAVAMKVYYADAGFVPRVAIL